MSISQRRHNIRPLSPKTLRPERKTSDSRFWTWRTATSSATDQQRVQQAVSAAAAAPSPPGRRLHFPGCIGGAERRLSYSRGVHSPIGRAHLWRGARRTIDGRRMIRWCPHVADGGAAVDGRGEVSTYPTQPLAELLRWFYTGWCFVYSIRCVICWFFFLIDSIWCFCFVFEEYFQSDAFSDWNFFIPMIILIIMIVRLENFYFFYLIGILKRFSKNDTFLAEIFRFQ